MSSFGNMHTLNIEQIQKIVDHFGIGKIQNVDKFESIEINNYILYLYTITTNKDKFVVIEYLIFIDNISEIQKAVDLKLNFQKPVFRYPKPVLRCPKPVFRYLKPVFMCTHKKPIKTYQTQKNTLNNAHTKPTH